MLTSSRGGGGGGGGDIAAHKYIQVPAVCTVAIGYHTVNLEVQMICIHWTVEKYELGTCAVDLEYLDVQKYLLLIMHN